MKEDKFETELRKSIDYIKFNRISEAEKVISELLLQNNHSSKIHNLLGIIAEISGKIDLSIIHYRVAYIIEPSYYPANSNLERVTSFNYKRKFKDINYGEVN